MARPKLYLFVGYPGAGKTTVAKIIEQATGAVHVWADHERRSMFEEPNHSAAESRQLYSYLNDKTADLLKAGQSVIFDTNFNFRKDRDHLQQIAAGNGASSQIIWVTTARHVAKHRAVHDSHDKPSRVWGNMTETDFDRMANNLEPPAGNENFIKIDGSDIDKEALLSYLSES